MDFGAYKKHFMTHCLLLEKSAEFVSVFIEAVFSFKVLCPKELKI
jgi:hypothetical protein